MSKKKGKRIVSIFLDEDVLNVVDETARNLGMSRSEFINFVLSAGLQAKEQIDKLIDKWFDQKKAEMKAKLEQSVKVSR